MLSSRKSAPAILMLALALLSIAPARGGSQTRTDDATAQRDSLVWYVEQLEHDLAVERARGRASAESLRVELRVVTWRAEAAEAALPRWYERGSFLVPVAVIMTSVALLAGGNLAR